METKETLIEIEKRAYRSTFDDGLYDILFGILFMIFAFIPVMKSAGIPEIYGFLIGAVMIIIPVLGKKNITIPRLGAVEFGEKRKARRNKLIIICLAIMFLMLPLQILMFTGNLLGKSNNGFSILLFAGFVVAPLLATLGYIFDYSRLYIYAIVLSVGIPHSEIMTNIVGEPLNQIITFGIPGAFILVYGLNLLSEFMKKYPKPTAEANHVSQ
jgi:hypothetical protein